MLICFSLCACFCLFSWNRYRAADEELATKVGLRNAIEEALYKAIGAAKEKKDAGALKELDGVSTPRDD